ncbi:energy transducer TonB [Noviherbaspirillum cavernae]|uniref:energy transducer TonB n=1 Tax=Noviherbaspirillum cavernae TaxID=2320862 RepID=UPI0013149C0E|nr:energy transducer TonB [Noviherbaspirillum cavernae]
MPCIAATLLLHAALVAAVVAGFANHKSVALEPPVITVALVPSTIDESTAPAPLPTAPSPPLEQARPEPRRSEPKRTAMPKPPSKPHTTTARESRTSSAPIEAEPSAPAIDNAPSTSTTAPASPAAAAAPVRTEPSISASYAAGNRKPQYPLMSRRFQEEGTVILRVFVKPDGTAGAVDIKTSSGHPLLDESARSAVQGWRFNPATSDGKPIAEWYQVPVPFTLEN